MQKIGTASLENDLNTIGESGKVSAHKVIHEVALVIHPADLLQHATVISKLLNRIQRIYPKLFRVHIWVTYMVLNFEKRLAKINNSTTKVEFGLEPNYIKSYCGTTAVFRGSNYLQGL